MIKKLLCYFGLHNHIEIVDEKLTKDWKEWCDAMSFPMTSPCTYLKCTRCGHTYGNTRTVGFAGSCIIPNLKEIK